MASVQLLSAQENAVHLFKHIVVNNTYSFEPKYDSILNLPTINIPTDRIANQLTIYIDSAAIKTHQLNAYRIFIDQDTVNARWCVYPIKEFSGLKKAHNQFILQAKNAKGEVFTEKILVITQFGIFNTLVAWFIYAFLFLGLFLVIYLYVDLHVARDKYKLETEISIRTKELSEQKSKYEEMLTNYLPKEDFEKLKETTKDKTQRYKMVTVLFSNILGFTKIAEQENAERLIDDLDRFFFEFDDVVQRLHIEKIKTIGDSYICAGGIPQKNRTNPIEVVLAAFEMQQYMQSLKDQYLLKNQKIWDLRMGIHTGPVFSNASASKKRLEIWGDTVNIASRMEASGEIGKVNITGMTYELVKDYFLCKYRGKMPVKYKGEIDMYFIEGFRPALSIDGFGIKPNKTFDIRLGLIRFDDLEEHVMNILEEKLPRNLYYHNLKHTIDVTVQVELIGRGEGITDEELLLLKTAALFHDTGFINTYKDHEEAGVLLAKSILPNYDYTQEQIDAIEKIIMVTKLPPKPKNLLQQIICDADLDYLGRVDFIPVSGNLFRELTEHKIIQDDINKWNEIQITFIEKHQYFTETAKRLRDVNKNIQLEAIRKLVEENS
jgi:class 3 adenylate cyclase/HD superfamily phosphodiesterase